MRNSIISDTLWKIQDLLNATRILLNEVEEDDDDIFLYSTGDATIPAGLYTFAVEEYGKFLYLKSLKPIDGKYTIEYVDEFIDHPKKFERALSELPDECKLLHMGEKIDIKFYDPDFSDDIIANFETRLRIFYSDFDPHFLNKATKTAPPVSVKLLKIANEKLWDIIDPIQTEHIKNKDD